jgi:hypothetical protein
MMVKLRDPWNSKIASRGFEVFEFGRVAELEKPAFINAWKRTNGGVVIW